MRLTLSLDRVRSRHELVQTLILYSLEHGDGQTDFSLLTLYREQLRVRFPFNKKTVRHLQNVHFLTLVAHFIESDINLKYLLLILMGRVAVLAVHSLRYIIIDLRPSLAGLVTITVRHIFSVFLLFVCGYGCSVSVVD
jgi:hypothetical protein